MPGFFLQKVLNRYSLYWFGRGVTGPHPVRRGELRYDRRSEETVRIPIAREGWPFIAAFAGGTALIAAFCPSVVGDIPPVLLTLWCVWFFRDPERATPQEAGLLIAPADGRVVAVEEVAAAPLSGQPARKVSIFMNVFSVHVNRMPAAGRIQRQVYHPGRFLNAALDKASLENERMELLLVTDAGPVVVVQVAGLVARRIVCRAGEGSQWLRGERFGLIRFGSRVDLYLPRTAQVSLNIGDRTRAGETIVAQVESSRANV
ncbi:MAG: phosphatidylserine decarboxylase family protein [Magnetococcales bacterium]|nr:phosphatidylserine decarboxylase family protein [Magnetococcales bacterium]MBF0322481.1 phosphatidylserine decarboxylase family protein [Magnetococcales bacterium]